MDTEIGTEWGEEKYAGPKYGWKSNDEYDELLESGALGRGQQTVEMAGERVVSHASNLYDKWETNVGKHIPDIPEPNETVKKALITAKDFAGHAYNWTIRENVEHATAVLGAPVEAAHWVSKKVDPTGRGIGRAPLGIAETVLTAGGPAALKGGKTLLTKGDDALRLLSKADDLTPALAYDGWVDETLSRRVIGNKPSIGTQQYLEMTTDEAVGAWKPITHGDRGQLLTGPERGADTSLSKAVRYVQEGRYDDLPHRVKKMITSTDKSADGVKYLAKYHGGKIMKAESHHILDIDFWGRALNTKDGDIVSNVLFKNKVYTGNEGRNIVYAWAGKRGHADHGLLHAMYKVIPSRVHVEKLMEQGIWSTLKPKAQARLLREVAYDQHRITNNFFSLKLAHIERQFPELAKLHPVHLQRKILKDPDKYGKIKVGLGEQIIDHKNPDHVWGLFQTLKESPYTGGTTDKLQEVFGLTTPKAGAKKYFGSEAQINFDKNIDYRINQAFKSKKK